MLDDLRSYLQMASGITEATTAKAREVVTGLVTTGISLTSRAWPAPDMVGQVQELADDLVTTSRNNREMLVGLIRAEVDRAVGRMGFVREDELAALRRHVQRLEHDLDALREGSVSVVPKGDTQPAEAAGASVEVVDSPLDPTANVVDESGLIDTVEAEEAVVGEFGDVPVKRKKKIILEGGDSTDGG